MVNRGSPQPNTGEVTAALNTMSIQDATLHPPLRTANSDPSGGPGPTLALGGIAARRMRGNLPKLNASDISDSFPSGGGPSGAGLGGGRPSLPVQNQRKSPQINLGTPFSNFRKIV